MTYTCQNCGSAADNSSSLCNPTSEERENKFCGIPADEVCEEKLPTMKYSCEACGSVSADAEHLCEPSMIS